MFQSSNEIKTSKDKYKSKFNILKTTQIKFQKPKTI